MHVISIADRRWCLRIGNLSNTWLPGTQTKIIFPFEQSQACHILTIKLAVCVYDQNDV